VEIISAVREETLPAVLTEILPTKRAEIIDRTARDNTSSKNERLLTVLEKILPAIRLKRLLAVMVEIIPIVKEERFLTVMVGKR
jgi:hypothetical protein